MHFKNFCIFTHGEITIKPGISRYIKTGFVLMP